MQRKKEEYLKLIHEHFPTLHFGHSKIVRKGWDNDVVILDARVVFRFPKSENGKQKFVVELKLLDYLKSKNLLVQIPDYIYFAEGKSFGGYRLLRGSVMRDYNFRIVSSSGKKYIAKQLGQFLTTLHNISLSLANKLGIQRDEKGFYLGHESLGRAFGEIRQVVFPKLNNTEKEWIIHQFEYSLSLNPPPKYAVLHSDLGPDHILFDQKIGKISGIIDFADAEIGDPAADFGAVWEYGQQFADEVAKHYKPKTDADFFERSKTRSKVYMVLDMLQVLKGKAPMSFEQNHKLLQKAMKKYPVGNSESSGFVQDKWRGGGNQ